MRSSSQRTTQSARIFPFAVRKAAAQPVPGRELLHVVRDEAVQERRAVLAGQDDAPRAREVEEEGRAAMPGILASGAHAADPCDNGAP